jgi:hypothetical protein
METFVKISQKNPFVQLAWICLLSPQKKKKKKRAKKKALKKKS